MVINPTDRLVDPIFQTEVVPPQESPIQSRFVMRDPEDLPKIPDAQPPLIKTFWGNTPWEPPYLAALRDAFVRNFQMYYNRGRVARGLREESFDELSREMRGCHLTPFTGTFAEAKSLPMVLNINLTDNSVRFKYQSLTWNLHIGYPEEGENDPLKNAYLALEEPPCRIMFRDCTGDNDDVLGYGLLQWHLDALKEISDLVKILEEKGMEPTEMTYISGSHYGKEIHFFDKTNYVYNLVGPKKIERTDTGPVYLDFLQCQEESLTRLDILMNANAVPDQDP